ncbi:MAG: hypothetical protein QE494_05100 [Ramlibacter sp.]|nr:hypothetical protein [Ramlibacter sp.]MDH4375661.1 hypothetical protein [Ramlibacter sp.]
MDVDQIEKKLDLGPGGNRRSARFGAPFFQQRQSVRLGDERLQELY